MGEWIYRTDLHADWMSLMFFLNLLFILALFKIDPNRFKSLINILGSIVYFGKYSNDRELNYFSFFNMFSFFIITNSLALGYFSLSIYNIQSMELGFEFFYLLLGLVFVLSIRYLIVHAFCKELNIKHKIKILFFKNFTYATQYSIVLLGLLFLWNYSTIPLLFIESIIGVLLIVWVVNQFRLFFSFIKSHTNDVIYIFLYLCTFKIAPWFWVYYVFIETN